MAATWAAVLAWMQVNGVSEVTGVLGVLISTVGFGFTLFGVFKSKTAAERAEDAARSTRNTIHMFDTVVDFSAVIALFEEIKRLHRQASALPILPDRYAAMRKLLTELRNSRVILTDDHLATIQNAIANLSAIERQVEKAIVTQRGVDHVKLNALISADIDGLVAVLAQLRAKELEAHNDF